MLVGYVIVNKNNEFYCPRKAKWDKAPVVFDSKEDAEDFLPEEAGIAKLETIDLF